MILEATFKAIWNRITSVIVGKQNLQNAHGLRFTPYIIKQESRKSNVTSYFSLVGDSSHPFPSFRHKLPGRPMKQFGKQLQTVVTL